MTEDSSRPSGSGQDKIAAGIEQAREKAGQARGQLTETFTALNRTARDQAPKVRGKISASLTKAGQAIPEPARDTVVRTTRQATDAAEKRPAVLYAAAGVCTAAGFWLLRRGHKRGRRRRT